MKKKIYFYLLMMMGAQIQGMAATHEIMSPDGKMTVKINDDGGLLTYSVTYDGKTMIEPSRLGINTDMGDFTKNMKITTVKTGTVDTTYKMRGTKADGNHYVAQTAEIAINIPSTKRTMTVEMQVSNNAIAYRYAIDAAETTYRTEARRTTILNEASAFRFPEKTTTFICPQTSGDHVGWMNTKPSYEEEYEADAPMQKASRFGHGYTFPCLFHVGDDGWVLVSETGVGSNYCGSHLSDYDAAKGYTIAFPDQTENFGQGSPTPAISLPGKTPWRTISVGSTLKPIAETTIAYDVVEEQYAATTDYKPGRYTWSWLLWQDKSVNYDDQVKFINTAAAMGYEYCLVDNFWDVQIGREKIEELSRYAQSKGVGLMLWYNSNGAANDAPQSPRNCMNTAIAREREMTWLNKIGVTGIKVDFFGGDKQETMHLYEDILSDANRHGIQVIFHGCTLPRGWERMYPNFVASEAVLASENVYFEEKHAKTESFELTLHPFCRNAVASMDWGGSIINHYINKENNDKSRHRRYTTDTFEMACAIMNQTTIQCIAMQESNLTELQDFQLDFLKSVPTVWSETRFIDGYPGKYAVIARKAANGKWYVAALNGEEAPRTLTINLPMLAGQTVTYYTDAPLTKGELFPMPQKKTLKIDKNGNAKITLQGRGGGILFR